METKKYVFYSTTEVKENINFKKLGIVIRNINPEEKKILINNYEKILFTEDEVDTFSKAFQYLDNPDNLKMNNTKKDENENKFLEFLKFSKAKRDIALYFYKKINEEYKTLTRSELDIKANNLKIIEVNNDIFCRLFNEESAVKIINNLINFPFYVKNLDYELEKLENKIFNFDEIKDIKEKHELTGNGTFFQSFFYNSEFISDDLNTFADFLNNNNADFNFKFMLTIDKIYESPIFPENKIISLISVIESLLISKSSNKAKDFTLKVGIIIKSNEIIENEILKKQLDLIYTTRNYIVHGTEEEIEKSLKYYNEVFGENIKSAKNKFETRKNILNVVLIHVEAYLSVIFKQCLADNELIDYLKDSNK